MNTRNDTRTRPFSLVSLRETLRVTGPQTMETWILKLSAIDHYFTTLHMEPASLDPRTSPRAIDASLEAKIRNLQSLAAIRLKVTSILHEEADDDDDETARAPKLGVASSTSQSQTLRSRQAERAAGVRVDDIAATPPRPAALAA